MGIQVLAGDTDSLFILSPKKSQIESIRKFANEKYMVDMEVDKEYRTLVLSERKKNYVGVLVDDRLDIKGMTGKKSNTPIFARELFADALEIIKKIKSPADISNAREAIKLNIEKAKYNLKNIPLDKMAFRVTLNSEKYKVRTQGVKCAEMEGKTPRKGLVVSFIKTVGGIKPLSQSTHADLDRKKYENVIDTVMSQLLEPFQIIKKKESLDLFT